MTTNDTKKQASMKRWCAAMCLALACSSAPDREQPSVGPITESVYASGIVKAQEQYNVYSQVSGLVVMAYVSPGDVVEVGDPLFLIDDRASSLDRRNAELTVALLQKNASNTSPVLAQLRIARSQAKESLSNDRSLFEEAETLHEKGLTSDNDLDSKRLAFLASKRAYETANEAYVETEERLGNELEVARNKLAITDAAEGDRTVRSLLRGRVYDVLIERGELASAQVPLAVLGSADQFYLELNVDEYDIGRIEPDQRVVVSMDSYPGRVTKAVVARIDPLMDERSRTFTIEALFVDPPERLYPHLTAEANIVIRSEDRALTIPAEYLVNDRFVLINGKETQEVTVGLRDLERVEIVDGLDPSTTIYKP